MTTNVLIVDDSATARHALRLALESDPGVRVVGEAADRTEALDLVERLGPHLVTMDVVLRREDGIEVAAALMARSPVPILIVTARDRDPQLVYETLEAGALEVVQKLPAPSSPDYAARRRRLVRLVKTLAGVHVVRRRRPRGGDDRQPPPPAAPPAATWEVVLLGASTGGPPVLAHLLGHIEAPAPIPIVIVQHMATGFGEGFAAWLGALTGHPTQVVNGPRVLEPGVVYLAPSERHLVFDTRRSVCLNREPPRFYQRPSVDVLFESAAALVGGAAVAALLTGMGRDGAAGLAALHRTGAYTMAQKPSTCAVASMPETGITAGAADVVLAPDDIGAALRAGMATLLAARGR